MGSCHWKEEMALLYVHEKPLEAHMGTEPSFIRTKTPGETNWYQSWSLPVSGQTPVTPKYSDLDR